MRGCSPGIDGTAAEGRRGRLEPQQDEEQGSGQAGVLWRTMGQAGAAEAVGDGTGPSVRPRGSSRVRAGAWQAAGRPQTPGRTREGQGRTRGQAGGYGIETRARRRDEGGLGPGSGDGTGPDRAQGAVLRDAHPPLAVEAPLAERHVTPIVGGACALPPNSEPQRGGGGGLGLPARAAPGARGGVAPGHVRARPARERRVDNAAGPSRGLADQSAAGGGGMEAASHPMGRRRVRAARERGRCRRGGEAGGTTGGWIAGGGQDHSGSRWEGGSGTAGALRDEEQLPEGVCVCVCGERAGRIHRGQEGSLRPPPRGTPVATIWWGRCFQGRGVALGEGGVIGGVV